MHIINKPMFINGDGNWINLLNDVVVTYNNNKHTTIKKTTVDASNNPDKVKYIREPAGFSTDKVCSQIITSSKPSYSQL